MQRIFKLIFVTAIVAFLSGCTSGFLYHNVTKPLTKNMHQTPSGEKLATLDTRHIREPVTRAHFSAEWNSRAIGDAARKGGLREVYYADVNTFSILGGTWKQITVRVWGR